MPSPVSGLSPRALSRKFMNREDGSVTIEAVLWMPVFVFFFILVADVALVFNGQSKIQRLVQDANRYWSVGRLDCDGHKAFLTAALQNMSAAADIEIVRGNDPTTDTCETDDSLIITRVSIPARDLEAVGVIPGLDSLKLTVWSTHLREY